MIFVPSSTLVPDRQLTFDSYLRLQYLMAQNVSPNERYIQSLSSLEAVESGGEAEDACETDGGYPSRALLRQGRPRSCPAAGSARPGARPGRLMSRSAPQ